MAQGVQVVLPGALQCPSPQHTPASSELLVPGAQAMGVGVPREGQANPAGQGRQAAAEAAPAVLLYLPTAQAVHAVAPVALKAPRRQHTPLPGREKVLTGQGAQAALLEAPVRLKNVFIGQGVGAKERAGQALPTGQRMGMPEGQ